jgi:hypothetical protein
MTCTTHIPFFPKLCLSMKWILNFINIWQYMIHNLTIWIKSSFEHCTFKICKHHELGHLTYRLSNDVKEFHWPSQFWLNQCSVVVWIFKFKFVVSSPIKPTIQRTYYHHNFSPILINLSFFQFFHILFLKVRHGLIGYVNLKTTGYMQ